MDRESRESRELEQIAEKIFEKVYKNLIDDMIKERDTRMAEYDRNINILNDKIDDLREQVANFLDEVNKYKDNIDNNTNAVESMYQAVCRVNGCYSEANHTGYCSQHD